MAQQLSLRSFRRIYRRLLRLFQLIVFLRLLCLFFLRRMRISSLIVKNNSDSENQIVIGARGSPLSTIQVQTVIEALEKFYPHLKVMFLPIKTSGDSPDSKPQSGPGIKGLFVKEVDEALLRGQIDLSVHSAKDLPFERPSELSLGPVPPRAPAFDLLVSAKNYTLKTLPQGAAVGTSSLRRRAQLLAFRPDLKIVPLRGNIQTRLRKMSQTLDATIIAQAAAFRLKTELDFCEVLSPDIMLPAPGQGLLALEYRTQDSRLKNFLSKLDHSPSRLALTAERAFMGQMGAGCATPAAAWARSENQSLVMTVLLSDPMGQRVIKAEKAFLSPSPQKAFKLGCDLAEELKAQGGLEILAQCQNADFGVNL
jgi:hydroxymethylbilane synthase